MAVSITNNMTLWDSADGTTGWTGTDTLSTYSDILREGSNCLGCQASQGAEHSYHTDSGAPDLSTSTIFGWLRAGNPETKASGGFRIVVGDGTNRAGYYVGGSDDYGFFLIGWSCFKLNCASPLSNYATLAGTESSIDWVNITQIGGGWSYSTKAQGTVDNVFEDVFRYISNSSAALTVAGGGVGTEGEFADCVTLDENTSNAWGIFTQLVPGAKSYGANFGMEFGDSGTGSSYFSDSDFQIYFLGNDMASGAMDLTIIANSTGTNLFKLDNFVSVSIGTTSNWDLSDTDIDTMSITNGQFVDMGTFTFPTTGGTLRKCIDTMFVNCGQVDPDTMTFTDNTFVGTTDANGALLIDASGTSNISDLTFTSDGTGHAIYITAQGTYTFTDFLYSDYASTNGSTGNEVVYNNSGGLVTINVSGGDAPTYRNGSGASTVVSVSYSHIVTGLELNTEVTYVTAGTSTELFHVENASASDGDGKYQTTYSHSGGANVDILIHHVDYKPDISNIIGITLPNAETTVKVQMFEDLNYYNAP